MTCEAVLLSFYKIFMEKNSVSCDANHLKTNKLEENIPKTCCFNMLMADALRDNREKAIELCNDCLLYTSDAADE